MPKSAASALKQAIGSVDLVDEVVAECRAHLAVIAQRRAELVDGGFDPALTAAAGAMARVLLAAEAERRARHDRLSVAAINAWLSMATEEEKEEIAECLRSKKDLPLF
jgi:hypothetical protein